MAGWTDSFLAFGQLLIGLLNHFLNRSILASEIGAYNLQIAMHEGQRRIGRGGVIADILHNLDDRARPLQVALQD